MTAGNSIQNAPLQGCLVDNAKTAKTTWMAKQMPWAIAPARACCSKEAKPAFVPENSRIRVIKRFHPMTSSSHQKSPTPTTRCINAPGPYFVSRQVASVSGDLFRFFSEAFVVGFLGRAVPGENLAARQPLVRIGDDQLLVVHGIVVGDDDA